MKRKPRVTLEAVTEACESNQGWCTNCEEWTGESCEPDAAQYECPVCGHSTVYGAEEAMLLGIILIEG